MRYHDAKYAQMRYLQSFACIAFVQQKQSRPRYSEQQSDRMMPNGITAVVFICLPLLQMLCRGAEEAEMQRKTLCFEFVQFCATPAHLNAPFVV